MDFSDFLSTTPRRVPQNFATFPLPIQNGQIRLPSVLSSLDFFSMLLLSSSLPDRTIIGIGDSRHDEPHFSPPPTNYGRIL